jgi:hypothetical protein
VTDRSGRSAVTEMGGTGFQDVGITAMAARRSPSTRKKGQRDRKAACSRKIKKWWCEHTSISRDLSRCSRGRALAAPSAGDKTDSGSFAQLVRRTGYLNLPYEPTTHKSVDYRACLASKNIAILYNCSI